MRKDFCVTTYGRRCVLGLRFGQMYSDNRVRSRWQFHFACFCLVVSILTDCESYGEFWLVAAAPEIQPVGGLFSAAGQTVTITSATRSATLFFTTDGSAPAHSGDQPIGTTSVYKAPFLIAADAKVQAIAYQSSSGDSAVTSATLNFCPANYVLIPANSVVGEPANFCLAKFEMKCAADATGASCSGAPLSQAANQPWANITNPNSATACAGLGTRYHLVTNSEWMAMARNVEIQAQNWNGGAVYSGSLNQGHSDSSPLSTLAASTDDNQACTGTGQACSLTTWDAQRRTFALSTGEFIWDVGGNAYEHTNWIVPQASKAYVSGDGAPVNANREFNALNVFPAGNPEQYLPANSGLTSANGLKYYVGHTTTPGYASRGGNMAVGGVFSLHLGIDNLYTNSDHGFRCAYK